MPDDYAHLKDWIGRTQEIDDVIDPRETRPTIVKALRMARNKHVTKPAKRHGIMPV